MRGRSLCFIILFLCVAQHTFAQRKKKVRQERSPLQELSYTDKNYLPSIKTVEFYKEQEQSLPLLYLGSNESLSLAFDDLRGDHRTLYFSFEHCDADWKKSKLSVLEYASGYGEDRIRDFSLSRNTLQPFTHYQVQFPTENTRPLLAGNYLLKVYEDGDQDRLLLTRRFYVVQEQVAINAALGATMDVKTRNRNQRLEVSINTQNLSISNPNRDLKVLVMQNERPDVQLWADKPTSIRDNELGYAHPTLFNFEGGQEFLLVDLRSFRLESSMMKRLETDSIHRVALWEDRYLDPVVYQQDIDENGRFYIRNLDQQDQSPTLADYAEVTFSLKAPFQEQAIYLLGKFNNFDKTEENKMHYDPMSQSWTISKRLKQGVYDYTYATPPSPSFYETQNHYQILVYYRNPRLNRDEIIGFYDLKIAL